KELAKPVTLTGGVNEPYQTEPEEISGYKFVEVKGAPAAGEFKPESQTVTYVYQQQGTVTVRYVDTDDKELAEPITLTGGVNEPYQTEPEEISGYKFVEVKGAPATGEFKPESQTVTYVYQQQGTVTVRYVDTEDKELAKPITLTGGVNEPYQTEPEEISGYKFVEVKGAPAAGEFKAESQTVTYVYQQQGTVTVRYVDTEDKELAKPVTLTGGVNEPYQTEPEEISGYKFVEVKGAPAAGEFKPESQTVTYVYQQQGTVTVRYVDTDDKELAEPITLTGGVNEPYQTEPEEISGYKFVEVKGAPATGEFKPESQTVTYVYQQQGTVTVRYVDTEDKELAKPITLTGGVNEPYQTEPEEISGYKFVEVKGAPAAGEFKAESQTVTYVYQQQGTVTVRYVDTEDKELA
ncbi:MucBP domain-containing protein, partial [Vagococcus elongatus]